MSFIVMDTLNVSENLDRARKFRFHCYEFKVMMDNGSVNRIDIYVRQDNNEWFHQEMCTQIKNQKLHEYNFVDCDMDGYGFSYDETLDRCEYLCETTNVMVIDHLDKYTFGDNGNIFPLDTYSPFRLINYFNSL